MNGKTQRLSSKRTLRSGCLKLRRKANSKISWWTATVGDRVMYKGELGTITYIGRNQGEDTIVKLILPSRVKAKQVRIRELSWE